MATAVDSAHRRWMAPAIGLLVVASIAALATLPALTGSAGAAREASGPPPARHLTAPVRSGSLSSALHVTGQLATATVALELQSAVNGERAVVSKAPLTPGDEVVNGALIMEVSGEPRILLHGTVPLWRDVQLGDTGVDVTTLRRALIEDGHLDEGGPDVWNTEAVAAVEDLLADAGYSLDSILPPASTEELASQIDGAGARVQELEAPPAPSEVMAAESAVAEAQRQGQAARDEAVAAVELARQLIEDLDRQLDEAKTADEKARLERELKTARGDLSRAEGHVVRVSAAADEQVAMAEARLAELQAPPPELAEGRQELAQLEAQLHEAEQEAESTIPHRLFLMAPNLPARLVSSPPIGTMPEAASITLAAGEIVGTAKLPPDAAEIEAGMPVMARTTDQEFAGMVEVVQQSEDGLRMRASFENANRGIIDGNGPLPADLEVTTGTVERALIVPTIAITGSGEATKAQTIDGSSLVTHNVEVLLTADGESAITSETLEDGDEVLVGVR